MSEHNENNSSEYLLNTYCVLGIMLSYTHTLFYFIDSFYQCCEAIIIIIPISLIRK